MEEDELLKRVQMMQRLPGMETKPDSGDDSYDFMDRDQLISTLRNVVKWNEHLVKCIDERTEEIKELKDLVKELTEAHKQDTKTRERMLKTQ